MFFPIVPSSKFQVPSSKFESSTWNLELGTWNFLLLFENQQHRLAALGGSEFLRSFRALVVAQADRQDILLQLDDAEQFLAGFRAVLRRQFEGDRFLAGVRGI